MKLLQLKLQGPSLPWVPSKAVKGPCGMCTWSGVFVKCAKARCFYYNQLGGCLFPLQFFLSQSLHVVQGSGGEGSSVELCLGNLDQEYI